MRTADAYSWSIAANAERRPFGSRALCGRNSMDQGCATFCAALSARACEGFSGFIRTATRDTDGTASLSRARVLAPDTASGRASARRGATRIPTPSTRRRRREIARTLSTRVPFLEGHYTRGNQASGYRQALLPVPRFILSGTPNTGEELAETQTHLPRSDKMVTKKSVVMFRSIDRSSSAPKARPSAGP